MHERLSVRLCASVSVIHAIGGDILQTCGIRTVIYKRNIFKQFAHIQISSKQCPTAEYIIAAKRPFV